MTKISAICSIFQSFHLFFHYLFGKSLQQVYYRQCLTGKLVTLGSQNLLLNLVLLLYIRSNCLIMLFTLILHLKLSCYIFIMSLLFLFTKSFSIVPMVALFILLMCGLQITGLSKYFLCLNLYEIFKKNIQVHSILCECF